MARVKPLPREKIKEFEPLLGPIEAAMGFLPNSLLTMARRPEIMRAFAALAGAVRSGTVRPELKQLVAHISSTAAGCRYCKRTPHTPRRASAFHRRSLRQHGISRAITVSTRRKERPSDSRATLPWFRTP